jgi:hypothetical protein
VLLRGSKSALELCWSETIQLCDPRHPETQQPYHAAMGELETDEIKLNQRIEVVCRITEQAIVDLVKRCATDGRAVRRAALVIGTVIAHKESIANPHIRAHAFEGRLFRKTLEAALQAQGIRGAVYRERDTYGTATKSLRQSSERIKRALNKLGPRENGWRADQKLAASAARLVL